MASLEDMEQADQALLRKSTASLAIRNSPRDSHTRTQPRRAISPSRLWLRVCRGDVQDKGSVKAFIAYLHVIVQQSSGLMSSSTQLPRPGSNGATLTRDRWMSSIPRP
jgi:hypothetical protein